MFIERCSIDCHRSSNLDKETLEYQYLPSVMQNVNFKILAPLIAFSVPVTASQKCDLTFKKYIYFPYSTKVCSRTVSDC